MEQPDDIVAHVNHIWSNVGPDMSMIYLQYALALVIILLVPSLNLCGLSSSRMQQRTAELGVRKAFGATRGVLIRQMLNENLVLSVVGGIVGLVLQPERRFVRRVQPEHGRLVQPHGVCAGVPILCAYQPAECLAARLDGHAPQHCRIAV